MAEKAAASFLQRFQRVCILSFSAGSSHFRTGERRGNSGRRPAASSHPLSAASARASIWPDTPEKAGP